MQLLLNVFIEPDALVSEYEKLRTRYALIASLLFSAMLLYPNLLITNTLLEKQMQSLGLSLSQGQIILSIIGGFFSQAIGLLIKWSFSAFFFLTVAQFFSLKRKGEIAPEMTFKGILRIVAYCSLIEIVFHAVRNCSRMKRGIEK
jgi:hypothetical protein